MSKWWGPETVAVVTGANKGIGFEIVKILTLEGLTCVLTARDAEKGQAAADLLSREAGRHVPFHQLDITSAQSIGAFAQWMQITYGSFDILVNNAGFAYHGNTFGPEEARTTIAVNVYGTMALCDALVPLLRVNSPHRPRIVNVCSMAGKLKIVAEPLRSRFKNATDPAEVRELMEKFTDDIEDFRHRQEGWPQSMYAVSKLGEATYTRCLARRLQPHGVLVNACCPGWCATDMSSWRGPKTAVQGADTPCWLALAPLDSATGGFFSERNREPF